MTAHGRCGGLWLAICAGALSGTVSAQPAVRAAGPSPEQTFYENLSIQTVAPTITLYCTGAGHCLPDAVRMDLTNNGYGFFVSEPGEDGILLELLNSTSSSPHAFVKAPLAIGPSWSGSPYGGSSLTVWGNGNGRVVIQDTATPVAGRNLLRLLNNGPSTFRFENVASGAVWGFGSIVAEDKFFISKGGAAGLDLTLDGAGNLVILGTLTQLSDRNAKRDVQELDGRELLRKLADLPLSSWSYKADEQAARHVGPMAQDFSAAFGLGHDDRHVAPSDVAGVSLAAAQALQRELEARLAEKDAQIAALAERLAALERALPAPPGRAVQ